jgi:acyl carrier protein
MQMMPTVRAILQEQLKIPADKITPDLSINGIPQWDSLAHLELMMYLEEAHALEINEDSILDCSSVRGLCDRLGLDL